MAIVLTNGKYYIAHDASGKIIKVQRKSEAQDFRTVERAIALKRRCCGKIKGYYPLDTVLEKMRWKESEYVITDGKYYIGYDYESKREIVVQDYEHSVKLKYARTISILNSLSDGIINMSDWKILSTVEIENDFSAVENLDIDILLESDFLLDVGSVLLSKRKIYVELKLAQVEREVTDIYHAMEFFNYGVCNGFKMYKLLQEKLIQRRKIKNEMKKIDYILSGMYNELSAEQILDNIRRMDHRKYQPRALKELFEV